MIEVIKKSEKERFESKLKKITSRSVGLDAGLLERVSRIVEDVKARGDEALIEYTQMFDGVLLTTETLRFDENHLQQSAAKADTKTVEALREAIKRVQEFHLHQIEKSWTIEPNPGVKLGQKITPIEKAGLYVPGGTASYPSSVIMNVIPAQVAGVKRLIVVTPPKTLSENPVVSAALLELGITEIYAIGGAQAVAALTFGTQTIPKVDKITGPGNKYVAAAKKLVFGAVGIDSIAGPSEILIIADRSADARFVASDLLAQAEHDIEASSILLTTSEKLAGNVAIEVEKQARQLPRFEIVNHSIRNFGVIFVLDSISEIIDLANELAPEHLEIIAENEDEIVDQIENAGAIFLGSHTPEAVGDYFAGPNHVLPTCQTARFSSALGVYDFIKRTSILRFSQNELAETSSHIESLALSEGLDGHARSVMIRVEEKALNAIESGKE